MLRVPVQTLIPGDLTLDPSASHYISRVHRLRAGDSLLLFHPREAREADATIVEITRTAVRCQVTNVRPAATRSPRPLTLLQAIGKGDKADAVVRDATELGATRIVIVESKRTVVRLGDRAPSRLDRLRRIADEAARQCGRADAPEVLGPLDWDSALLLAEDDALKLCLWERASDPAGPILVQLGPARPLVVAVGPEGGLEESEIEAARAAGFDIVSLGPVILRTETVAAAVLGAALVLGSAQDPVGFGRGSR